MSYASWSVVFGEQPSPTKWNVLGSNDASFNGVSGNRYFGAINKSSITIREYTV